MLAGPLAKFLPFDDQEHVFSSPLRGTRTLSGVVLANDLASQQWKYV